jgi:hypothetical protein
VVSVKKIFNPSNVTRMLWATAYFVVGAELIVSSAFQAKKVFKK